jgi:hypothetical protein
VTPSAFFRATSPALVAELGMFILVRGLPPSTETSFLALALVSWVALPALAGFRVSRAGGSLLLASVGGGAVSGVTLLCAAISELLLTRDALAFGGLALATFLIGFPMQALFGFVAGWAARLRARRGA